MKLRWWKGELLPVCENTRLRILIDKAEMTDRFFWKKARKNQASLASRPERGSIRKDQLRVSLSENSRISIP